jgi:urea transport system substrate-binding protein
MTALEARRLVDAEGCPVVVAATTCPAFTTASKALRGRPALLIFSAANEGGPTGDRLIRLGERPYAQLAGAVPHVMSTADGRRWFLAGSDISWPRATNACARSIIDRAGGTIVGERLMSPSSKDLAPLIGAIERSGAECVLSTFFGADAAAFEREFYWSGLRERCRTLAPALDEATLEYIGADAGTGIWSVFGYFEQLPTAENRAFLRRYRKRFGPFAPPPSSHSESVYETVHLLAAAARRARSWHPTDVGRATAASRYHGPRGPVALAGPDGLRQELFLAEATDGTYSVQRPIAKIRAPT